MTKPLIAVWKMELLALGAMSTHVLLSGAESTSSAQFQIQAANHDVVAIGYDTGAVQVWTMGPRTARTQTRTPNLSLLTLRISVSSHTESQSPHTLILEPCTGVGRGQRRPVLYSGGPGAACSVSGSLSWLCQVL